MSRGTEIVAVIAQQPFWTGENQFATARPIAVIDDGRLELVREGEYPNRDLCWWMIRAISPMRDVVPGRLIVGCIEDADRFDPHDPDKDKYQLAWDSVRLGGPKSIIEVIEGPATLDPRALVNRPGLLRLDHPPTSFVLVRLGDKVYGPLKAEVEPRGRQYQIYLERPPSSDLTSVLDAGQVRSDPGFIHVSGVELAADDRPTNRSADLFYSGFHVLLWHRFEALQAGTLERIRLLSDEEIVRRAAKQALSKRRLRAFMQEWADIREVYLASQAPEEEPDVAEVFQALNTRLQAQCDSVDELMLGVLGSGDLDGRVQGAIAHASQEYVKSHAALLNAEIAERVAATRQQEEDLRKEVQQLENELDRKRRQEEANLQAELSRHRGEFNAWAGVERAAIERERAEIDTRREQLERGLNQAATRFTEGRDALVADFLSLSPFLRQLGALAGVGDVGKPLTGTAEGLPARVEPPAFLAGQSGSEGLTDEKTFFERFAQHVDRAGFRYKRADLLAFHLSTKCGDLTVLGGMSGTGKSSLPVLYAQALSGDLNRYRRVDVSPAWLEPGDLLGRPNLLEKHFQPAPTGVFEALVWAATELERLGKDSRMWILCLDEMNLAQPEHYFSGFLQALPHDGHQRAIDIFAESSVRPDDPWRVWHRVPLGTNLRFVGTVNYDETTKPLSQRLLDRANQLELEAVPFGSLQLGATTAVAAPEGPPVTVASFEAWTREAPLTGKAAAVIDALQEPLALLGCPLTPRRYQAITRFVASSQGLCSPEEAFDMQLRQRVLSQIRGLFRPEARRALDSVHGVLTDHGSAFAGAVRLVERIHAETAREIDFESFDAGS